MSTPTISAKRSLAQPSDNLLFIPLLAILLSGCSTYKKVYTANPYIQVKQGFYKTEVVNEVKGRYVTMRVWNLAPKSVMFDLQISHAILPGGMLRYHGIIGGRSYFNTEKYFIPEGTGFTGFEFNLVNSTKLAGNSSGSGVTGPDGKQVEVRQYSSGS